MTTSLLTLFLQCIVHLISPGKGKDLLAIFAQVLHRCPMNEPNLQHAVLLFFLISHPSILQFISQIVIRSMVFLAGVVSWRG